MIRLMVTEKQRRELLAKLDEILERQPTHVEHLHTLFDMLLRQLNERDAKVAR